MGSSLFKSIALHCLIVLFFAYELPKFKKSMDLDFHTIPVEVLDISQATTIIKKSQAKKKPETPKTQPKQDLPKPSQNKEIKINKYTEVPPKHIPSSDQKPQSDNAAPDLEKIKKDQQPTPKKKEVQKSAQPLPKQVPRGVVKKTQQPEKEEPKEVLDHDPMASVLKNVANIKRDFVETKPNPDAKKNDPAEEQEEDEAIAPLSDRLTISEQDALRRQIEGCWNVPAGARNAEDLMIEIKVDMHPDRTVKQASIVNQRLYLTDAFFKAAADSAKRALLNPRCSPLLLPEGKYSQWKTFTISFNPKDMLTAY